MFCNKKLKKIMYSILVVIFLIITNTILLTNAADVLWGSEEQKERSEYWEILEILGVDCKDEDGKRDYSQLSGPGVTEDFKSLVEIAKKWKNGSITDAEKEKLQKYIFGEIDYYDNKVKRSTDSEAKKLPEIGDYNQVAKFNLDKMAEHYFLMGMREDERAERIENKEENEGDKYGYVTLDCELLDDDFQILCKGNITPLSLLKSAGLKVYTRSTAYGQYIYRIEDKEEVVGGLHGAGWVYYINGEWGTESCDKYKCKRGDVITWEYITW